MILYTPMQLELVLAGLEQMTHCSERKTTVNGVPALVRNVGGKEELVRLLSTDPMDYLSADLYPGARVKPSS
ncbi:YlzJ-like family protein [Desulfallas thermosapovorans]|uniref:YlzJ-like protein n=1 Tax=Desulfallas thermosapovorans DSM 6562 TaxID=1121431 RepID=A0A5S4ZYD1_9FIRM|nr:YlzJ-like family protein [Desulfallas thermosapovorans]TYO97865.1 YlzJ-like protein [Desulfallas thermosapovorans DSM 6562]